MGSLGERVEESLCGHCATATQNCRSVMGAPMSAHTPAPRVGRRGDRRVTWPGLLSFRTVRAWCVAAVGEFPRLVASLPAIKEVC